MSGRLTEDPQQIVLKVAMEPYEAEDVGQPLLVGAPRLAGGDLWIPTLAGLEIRDVRTPGAEETCRLVAWPPGAHGGTPFPLSGGRLMTVYLGDITRGIGGFVEILGE